MNVFKSIKLLLSKYIIIKKLSNQKDNDLVQLKPYQILFLFS